MQTLWCHTHCACGFKLPPRWLELTSNHACHCSFWLNCPLLSLLEVWRSLLPSSWSPWGIIIWLEGKGLASESLICRKILERLTQVMAALWSPRYISSQIATLGNVTVLERFLQLSHMQCGYVHAEGLLHSERCLESPPNRGLRSSRDCHSSKAKNLTLNLCSPSQKPKTTDRTSPAV